MSGLIKRYMTIPEVAMYFSVSKSLVYELVQEGKVEVWHPSGRPGTRGMRVLVESVTRLEAAGKINHDEYDL